MPSKTAILSFQDPQITHVRDLGGRDLTVITFFVALEDCYD
jgi:hypothetical protein